MIIFVNADKNRRSEHHCWLPQKTIKPLTSNIFLAAKVLILFVI